MLNVAIPKYFWQIDKPSQNVFLLEKNISIFLNVKYEQEYPTNWTKNKNLRKKC